MFPLLPRLDERGIARYFQFMLNDYEAEHLEPHVPPLEERVETFLELSEMAGKHRVIWRFDPLLLMDGLGPSELLAKMVRVREKFTPIQKSL
jgi:DNA repair photolyase